MYLNFSFTSATYVCATHAEADIMTLCILQNAQKKNHWFTVVLINSNISGKLWLYVQQMKSSLDCFSLSNPEFKVQLSFLN